MGKKTAQKDTIIDTTSDSQVNSNFPYRWSPSSLTFNNYFYLFLYLYITRIIINNNTPHLKSPKNQNRTVKIILTCSALQNTLHIPEYTFLASQSTLGSSFHTLLRGHPSDTDKLQTQGHFLNGIFFHIDDI